MKKEIKKPKRIRYFLSLEGFAGFKRVDEITPELWSRPQDIFMIAIPQAVDGLDFEYDVLSPTISTSIKLVFVLKGRSFNILTYRFEGYIT